jgi:hypothetical protein
MLAAAATCAVPAFAQNNAAPAARTVTGYGAAAPAPVDRAAKNRNSEQQLLGAPREYSDGGTQGNTDDAQRAALLDEQRMTVTDGQPAPRKGQRKAPAAANGPLRVAGQPGRANAGDSLLPAGAAKNTYTDPYGAGKRSVYRSPW